MLLNVKVEMQALATAEKVEKFRPREQGFAPNFRAGIPALEHRKPGKAK